MKVKFWFYRIQMQHNGMPWLKCDSLQYLTNHFMDVVEIWF